MKINILAWMGIAAVVWVIGSSGRLFAEPVTVGDYTLTVTEGDPVTNPEEAKVPRGKKSKVFFVVTLEDNTETNTEATYPEIDKIIYTITIDPSNSAGFRYESETKVTAKLDDKFVTFEGRISDGSAIHTYETDGDILTEITAILNNTLLGENTATLSVTVYPEEGDSIPESHEISVEGLGYSAFAYVKEGNLNTNREGKYEWDMINTANTRMSIIGHVTWKVRIPPESRSSLTSDERAADWFKKYNDKQVGFALSDEANDQQQIRESLELRRQTGDFSVFSAQGKLYSHNIGEEKGQHGISLEDAKAGLQFIAEHFGRKNDPYGAEHNCVDMAVEGLNAASVDRGKIGKTHIKVIYRDLNGKRQTNGKIDLSLPKDFGEQYATPD